MNRRALVLIAALAALPSEALARSGTPPADKSDVCASGTGFRCTDCHSLGPSSTLVPGPGLSAPLGLAGLPPQDLPTQYTPGQVYNLLVQVVEQETARCRGSMGTACGATGAADDCYFGFQLAAVLEASCSAAAQVSAGTLTAGGFPSPTQVVTGGPRGLTFVEHNCGNEPDSGTNNQKTWVFSWQAPAAGSGTVHFYYAVNSANGSFSNQGDFPHFFDAKMIEGGGARPVDITKAVNPPSVGTGGQAQFTITIDNRTGGTDLTGCQLTDNMTGTTCMTLVDASCVATPTMPGLICQSGIVGDPGFTVPAGGTQRITFTVDAGAVTGPCVNTVSVACSGATGNNQATLDIQAPTSCDLRRNASPTLGPPLDKAALFSDTTTCAGPPVDPLPPNVLSAGFTGLAGGFDDNVNPGEPIVVYKVSCSCAGVLRALKKTVLPGVHLQWN